MHRKVDIQATESAWGQREWKETGMSGNFLSCSKDVKDVLEVSEVRCD